MVLFDGNNEYLILYITTTKRNQIFKIDYVYYSFMHTIQYYSILIV